MATPDLPDAVSPLTFDRVSFKAAHNSMDRGLSLAEQLDWEPRRPHVSGCRGLELDLVQSSDGWRWAVKHGGRYSSTTKQLDAWLDELRTWGRRNRQSGVVTVHLDVKNIPGDKRTSAYARELDAYIAANFDADRIFRPGELLAPGKTLVESVRDRGGWLALEGMRGRFVFCLSGNDIAKDVYTATDFPNRLCFADIQIGWPDSLGSLARKGNRIFLNVFAAAATDDTWPRTVAWAAGLPGFVVRVFGINTSARWRRALRCGANVVSINALDAQWATVGPALYAAKANGEG